MKDTAEVLMLLSSRRMTVSVMFTETAGDASIYKGTNDNDTVLVYIKRTYIPEFSAADAVFV